MSKLNLPIDVVKSLPGTGGQLRFKWRMTTHSVPGKKSMECEGTLPPSVEGAVAELITITKQQTREIETLKRRMYGPDSMTEVIEQQVKEISDLKRQLEEQQDGDHSLDPKPRKNRR